MSETTAVTEQLAAWMIATRYEHLPPEVRAKTVDVIYDSVGCMYACSTLGEVKTIVAFIADQGGKAECSLIGQKTKSIVVNAAMAHGCMAHGDEIDPVHLASVGGHVAAGPVPAALAVGELLGSSGKDIVRAVALGYELGGRMMKLFYLAHDYISRRFYPTAVIGCLSSAVTAGLLMGLDQKKLQIAMGLAAYQAAGPDNMMYDTGHFGKTFQVAAACRNGVTAALLARRGAHVPLDILDGTLGLFDTYLNKPELGAQLLPDLGKYFSITDVMHKRYSTGTPNQAYVQGLLSVLGSNKISTENIESIEIQMHKPGLHTTPKSRPASIATNVVSAVAVVERKLDFYRLHDPAGGIVSPAVTDMQKRIRVVPRGDWQGLEHNRHAIISVTTRDGKKFEEETWFRPMTRPELDEKFAELVTPLAGASGTGKLKALLQGIESAANIHPLMEALRG